MLAERFSASHKSLRQFCHFKKSPEIADIYAMIIRIHVTLSLLMYYKKGKFCPLKVIVCLVTLSHVILALPASRKGSSEQSQQDNFTSR